MGRISRFATGEFYHIFNRGLDKRMVFLDSEDAERFLQSMQEFNSSEPIGSLFENFFRKSQSRGRAAKPSKKLVNIICYCLNPNHYHLLLEQNVEKGISEFMKRLNGGYTHYFNIKNKRNGALFQGKFKAVHVDSNSYLLHLSAYINLNNRVHRLKRTIKSSWKEYVNDFDGVCSKEIILDQFNNVSEYVSFAESSLRDIVERKKLKKELENLLLE
uniref:Transposase n=2 Tax=Candidatus Giovannoniibacteriota TaxID=1752738 RepID=A0A0G0ZJ49_9BACT|nr:MAG: Transposase [Candidatus Giovannonibacteria bacterium GW2011_GWF2_42_19]